jgi:hypothetical protein
LNATLTRLIALALLVGASGTARAEAMFGALTGYQSGKLSRSTEEPFTAFAAQGLAGYIFPNVTVLGFFHHMDVAYAFNDTGYQGLYSASGLGLGFSRYVNAKTKLHKMSMMLQVPLSSTLILLSETKGSVNEANYTHSTLTTMKGGAAFQALFGYEWLVVGRGGKSKAAENFYCGVHLGYLSQSFTEQTTRIKTNNSVLAPKSPGKETIDTKLTVMSLNFSVVYDLY